MLRALNDGQKGQALVIAALTMVVLVGSLALAVDGGNAYAQRRAMQNAVDAMAMAGAYAHAEGGDIYAVYQAINDYAQLNGVDSSDMVWDYVYEEGEPVGVVVTTTTTFPTFFAGVMGVDSLTLSTSATAEVGQRLGAWNYGISVGASLDIKGEGHTIIGNLHSDGDMHLSGDEITISGTLSYAGHCTGDLCPPEPTAPESWPAPYNIVDYQPGGEMAVAAGADYHYIDGHLDLPCSSPYGLYYATGNVTIDCEVISGTVTVVAEGVITLGGENSNLTPYSEGLLFFSNADGEAIKLTGETHTLEGIVYAPQGQIKIQAEDLTLTGSIIGESARFTGGSEGATIVFHNYLPGKPFLSR